MTFADKLKALRQEKKMTQENLAERSGIPIGTIRDYEQGKRDPLLSNAQRLAKALGVSLDVFPVLDSEKGRPAPKKPRPRRRKEK
jgi:transcriptional regulator with XRE-family HTH domain